MTLIDPAQSATASAGSIPAQRKTVRPAGRAKGTSRDRYIDCLRAAALVRVVIYHLFGWIWLPVLFPSMGIMFALAGSLVAASLDRSPGRPWRVLAKRTRRLLPPLWLMGLIVVPVMIWHGWTYTDSTRSPLRWRTLLLWIFPISDPPGSAWGDDFVVPLWYIRAYLWFLLLSPAFLWMFRRWPKRVLSIPLCTLALGSFGVLTLSGRSGDVILTMGIFGACWMLGFAHHDKTLRAVPVRKIVPLGVALLGAGLAWALTHQDPQSHWDIDNIPVAEALYGLGAVLLLLRFYPDFSWVARRPVLDKLVTVVNSRAMTIYLWNNIAISLAIAVAGAWSVTAALDNGAVTGRIQQFVLTWLLIAVAIVVFGWVEDLAAARPIRINPWPRTRQAGTGQSRRQPARQPARRQPARQPARRQFGRHQPGRHQPARALRPAPMLLGTAAVVATAVGISLGTLQGTGTPGRTGVTDTVPNTPAHRQALRMRPANLAQPNVRPPVRSLRQDLMGGARPASEPMTTTSPQQRPAAGPSPTPAQADSRAPTGPVSESSSRPVASTAPDAQSTASVSPTPAGPVPASPTTPPASAATASSAAPTPASPAAPVSPTADGTAADGTAADGTAADGTAADGPVQGPSSPVRRHRPGRER